MFKDIQKLLQSQFQSMSSDCLFQVAVDHNILWDKYLGAFPDEYKQENNCNCCKHFIKQYGSIVGIKNNKIITLWDFVTDDPEYSEPIKVIGDYIRNLPIKGIFLNTQKTCGTVKSPDTVRGIVWNHYNLEFSTAFNKSNIGPIVGSALDDKNVLQRSLNEITDDALDSVLELIAQNSLYRGTEFKFTIDEFQKIKQQYKTIKNTAHKDNFCWAESRKTKPAISRIRNSAIGTLLIDISEGRELDAAVTAFEKIVAPTNYKRPTSLITPKMIDTARARLEELNLTGSLYRRMLSDIDLNINNTLFVDRPKQKNNDIFTELKQEVIINPKTLSKVEQISINDFVEKVLHTTKSLKILVENNHFGNFVSLVGPKNSDDTTLFKWGNNNSWSYTGEVADSIKQRVKDAGGNVDGVLRISLSWNNADDLDLHLIEPKYRVFYSNKRVLSPSGAILDVDANGGDGIMENPVENIYWTQLPKIEGDFEIIVNNYYCRTSTNQGFEVEIEFEGETYNFSFNKNGNTGHNHKIATFNYTKKSGFSITSDHTNSISKYKSKEKWNIKTGQFQKVKAVTLSPNYWNANFGNKHFMFFLEGCKSDEKCRGFYNEFLKEELLKDRKVFEILGNKVSVEPSENELSGLGFSDTVRNSFYAEVTGKIKRIVKVNI